MVKGLSNYAETPSINNFIRLKRINDGKVKSTVLNLLPTCARKIFFFPTNC